MLAKRPTSLISALPLHFVGASNREQPVQICNFVFNSFHDAPPATPFLSSFCIVAGGWVGTWSEVGAVLLKTRSDSPVPFIINRLLTLWRHRQVITSLESIVCALFLVQRRGVSQSGLHLDHHVRARLPEDSC